MNEYIDADFATICDEWQPTVTNGKEQDFIKREDAENIMLGSCDESALWKLRHLPSADVAEVRHAKDIGYESSYGWKDVCSLCGCEFGTSKSANYCPNCGAKIDGEEQEHE